MDILIGRCGIACGLCKRYGSECPGCENENGEEHICIIYNCAVKKNINYCIQCPEAPCKLMRGLSKAYCPVCSHLKIPGLKEKVSIIAEG